MVTNTTRIYASTLRVFTLLFVLVLTTGCATVLKGTTQEIPISSEPPGADILVDGTFVGTTPADVQLKRKRDHLIVIEKKGHSSRSVAVVKNVGGAVWGNIIAGGLIGWGVDAASGAQNNLTPTTISVTLEPVDEGMMADASKPDSSEGIRKLNDLDRMREKELITGDEYRQARIALIREYFPEMIPEPEDTESDDSIGSTLN